MLQTRSSITLVAVTNTQAGGSAVVITNSQNLGVNVQNSAGWIVYVANTVAGGSAVSITNSGGLYAMQSGVWSVSSTILNSAGWVVNVANTSPLVSVQNSAGWVVNVANTANRTVIVNNSGGLFANQSGTWTVGISNSAGWVFNQANTGGNVNVANSAGWAVFAVDSASVGSVVTVVASTVGTVTLAASQTKRVSLSLYNASANPLFMKLGASATTASYTLMMVGSGYYELPRPIYNGIITGIWQTANGNCYVTETT